MELTKLKGVGPKTALRLQLAGISFAEQLLAIPPRHYEDRREITPIDKACEKPFATVCAKVEAVSFRAGFGRHKPTASVRLKDDTGIIHASFFGAPAKGVRNLFLTGRRVLMSASVKIIKKTAVLQHPEYVFLDDESVDPGQLAEIRPIYPSVAGFSQKQIRAFIRSAFDAVADRLLDALPTKTLDFDFPSLKESLRQIHFPSKTCNVELLNENRTPAQQRMIFDELFFLQLGLRIRRRSYRKRKAYSSGNSRFRLEKAIRRDISFTLTNDQERVLREIKGDIVSDKPMHRLLQGDVGSGKTIVALLAAAAVIESGFQAALMVPTEVLAMQHYRNIAPLAKSAGIRTAFLTGGISTSASSEIVENVRRGAVDLLIGTHALIGDRVEFKKLGLIIIDEQHRFGVLQRAKLRQKQRYPHVLVMSATPIPRTMALTVFGDLDHSVIIGKPAGRQTVKTMLMSDDAKAYQIVKEKVRRGEQAYIVYPLVEESENLPIRDASTMFARLRKTHLSDCRLGLLHGRMKEEEKREVLMRFMDRDLDVLISTTVIEVGVDVPDATVMLIENAERFGLSQLHQLRGRVGRADKPGICIFSVSADVGEKAAKRLRTLLQCNDGFQIADEDLALRGPGDILGRRQHGLPLFRWASLARDLDPLVQAQKAAEKLLEIDPELKAHKDVARILRHRWENKIEFETIG
jgi:ATP-dependent DNA helicase RecG